MWPSPCHPTLESLSLQRPAPCRPARRANQPTCALGRVTPPPQNHHSLIGHSHPFAPTLFSVGRSPLLPPNHQPTNESQVKPHHALTQPPPSPPTSLISLIPQTSPLPHPRHPPTNPPHPSHSIKRNREIELIESELDILID